jgi:hypothetical protein
MCRAAPYQHDAGADDLDEDDAGCDAITRLAQYFTINFIVHLIALVGCGRLRRLRNFATRRSYLVTVRRGDPHRFGQVMLGSSGVVSVW